MARLGRGWERKVRGGVRKVVMGSMCIQSC